MAGLMATIAGGATTLGSAIYGTVASSAANRRARKLIGQQRDENRRWYNTKMNEDYTSRPDAQAVIEKQRELLGERYRQARATAAVSGATDEAVAMQKEAANDALADTMSGIAAEAAEYKEGVESRYRAEDNALNQQQAQIEARRGAATAQAAAQGVSAGLNLIGQGVSAMEEEKIRKAAL